MITITIDDNGGKEPLPICRNNRVWLVNYYKVPELIVLRYFTNELPVEDQKKQEEEKAVKHLKECPRCREWVSSIVPKNIFQRQGRMARYCCSGMFCAVEEARERKSPEFSFTMFRGEDPCWQIDGKNAFANFCPWCGKKLPQKPFIE